MNIFKSNLSYELCYGSYLIKQVYSIHLRTMYENMTILLFLLLWLESFICVKVLKTFDATGGFALMEDIPFNVT